jgi:hypothetical protein
MEVMPGGRMRPNVPPVAHNEGGAQPPPVEAARTSARAVPPGSQQDKDRNKRLRELRDEIQDLRGVLSLVAKGDAALGEYAGYIERTKTDIATLLKSIPGADPVRRVVNIWEQMSETGVIKDPNAAFDSQALMLQLSLLDSLCRKLIFQVGMITIPERVNEWLALERPGYYLPFHAVFDDELPDYEDRVRVLNYLAWAPNAVEGGLVDAESGLIYRYSKDKAARQRSFAGALLALLLSTLAVVAVSYLPIQAWPIKPEHMGAMLVGWFAVIIGVLVHVAVGVSKRAQSREGRPPIVAAGDIFLLIDARLGEILLKLLMAMIGLLGLTFTAGAENVTPFNAFLVGYSLDSVVEMFSASLEKRAAESASAFKQRLGLDGES